MAESLFVFLLITALFHAVIYKIRIGMEQFRAKRVLQKAESRFKAANAYFQKTEERALKRSEEIIAEAEEQFRQLSWEKNLFLQVAQEHFHLLWELSPTGEYIGYIGIHAEGRFIVLAVVDSNGNRL